MEVLMAIHFESNIKAAETKCTELLHCGELHDKDELLKYQIAFIVSLFHVVFSDRRIPKTLWSIETKHPIYERS